MKRHESSLCQEACARPGCQNIARPGGEFCSSTCLESRHTPVAPNDCTCTDCTMSAPLLHKMQAHGGSFARALAAAWLLADAHNAECLRATFGPMLARYERAPEPDAPCGSPALHSSVDRLVWGFSRYLPAPTTEDLAALRVLVQAELDRFGLAVQWECVEHVRGLGFAGAVEALEALLPTEVPAS